jgi:hypothetical protein
VKNQIKPALSGVTISEPKVSTLDKALEVIYERHGPSSAKTTQSVQSGMFALALRHDACTVNPVRDTMTISVARSRPRALTDAEEKELLRLLPTVPLAVAHDLPDTRITGEGLVIQPRTKSDAGWRVIALPPFAVQMLRRRRGEVRPNAPGRHRVQRPRVQAST